MSTATTQARARGSVRTRSGRAIAGALLVGVTGLAGLAVVTAPAATSAAPGAAATALPPSARALDARAAERTKKRRFGPLRIGISTGFSSLYVTGDRLDADLDRAKRVGAGQLRLDVSWALIQPSHDVVDWARTDALFNAVHAKRIDILAVIGFAPEWAQNDDGSVKPELFADFVDAAAERYGPKVAAWEVWNEPNQDRSWVAKPDPAAYARVLEAASAPIRRRDPKAMILMGALAPAVDDPDGIEISPITFFKGVYRAGIDRSAYDAISIHPFSYPALPSGNQEWNTFHRLPDIHRVLVRHGDGAKPMWLTEYGARTGSTSRSVGYKRQTRVLLDAYRESKRLPFVQALFFYSLRDASPDLKEPEDNFGLLKYNGKPKPVYRALRRELRRH